MPAIGYALGLAFSAMTTKAPRPEITQLDFTGLDGSSFENTSGVGKSFMISGAETNYGVWFFATNETQPDLSAYDVNEYISVDVTTFDAEQVMQATRDALTGTGAFGQSTNGLVATLTATSDGPRVDAFDVNSGVAITIIQEGA